MPRHHSSGPAASGGPQRVPRGSPQPSHNVPNAPRGPQKKRRTRPPSHSPVPPHSGDAGRFTGHRWRPTTRPRLDDRAGQQADQEEHKEENLRDRSAQDNEGAQARDGDVQMDADAAEHNNNGDQAAQAAAQPPIRPPVIPHWSTWPYHKVAAWVETVEEDLPPRPVQDSRTALLITLLSIHSLKVLLLPENGPLRDGDILATGYPDEYAIKNMTPTKWEWIEGLINAGHLQRRLSDGSIYKAQLSPPDPFKYYDDLSCVLYPRQDGSHGIWSPKEVAASINRQARTPRPWRIYRMYRPNTRERLNTLKIIFETHADKGSAVRNHYLLVNGGKWTLRNYKSPYDAIFKHQQRRARNRPSSRSPSPDSHDSDHS